MAKLNHGLNISYKFVDFICQYIFKYCFWQVKLHLKLIISLSFIIMLKSYFH
jgi:hypothetical protein